MEQVKLDRLSELTKISRERELTDAEKSERETLRNEYRSQVRASLAGQLDNSTIVRPDGTKIRVRDMKHSKEDK